MLNHPQHPVNQMKHNKYKLFLILLSGIALFLLYSTHLNNKLNPTGAPPYSEAEEEVPDTTPFSKFVNWKRPDGPAKVGIQIGHWKSNELPDELEKLRSSTGTSGGGKYEWEVNLEISKELVKLLETNGITTELLPATVPPEYWADVFISIHADGSLNRLTNGFKIATPWRDWSLKGSKAADLIEISYGKTTNFPKDPKITRNMKGYYAFSWWKYEHAVHPMTTSLIIETGFLTNPYEQRILINKPELIARGIAEGLINYLDSENLLTKQDVQQ